MIATLSSSALGPAITHATRHLVGPMPQAASPDGGGGLPGPWDERAEKAGGLCAARAAAPAPAACGSTSARSRFSRRLPSRSRRVHGRPAGRSTRLVEAVLPWPAVALGLCAPFAGGDHPIERERRSAARATAAATCSACSGERCAVMNDADRSDGKPLVFFVASALHPVTRRLWTPPSDVLTHAADAVRASIDGQGLAQGVSTDVLPSWDPATYREFQSEPSPWGQGAALRAVAALARASRAGEPIASSPA